MSDERNPKNDLNPYAAPTSDVYQSDLSEGELASRFRRLVARLLDSFFGGILPMIVIFYIYDSLEAFLLTMFSDATNQAANASWLDLIFTGFGEGIASWWFFLLQVASYVALNAYLLATRGQTIGKLIMGVRIVGFHSSEIPPLTYSLIVREGGINLLGLLGTLGMLVFLVNPLFIFNKDRRCLHDYWSSTKVIRVQA